MKINFYGKSDKGKLRKNNEDYFSSEKINNKEYIFVVADGMGGHQAGDVASKLGTLTFISTYKTMRGKGFDVRYSLTGAINEANNTILEKASDDLRKRGMGTTFSAIAIVETGACIVHVGDSRVYVVRNNDIMRLTTDHTFVEKMVEEGRLTEEEARDHPQKNILYMSLGAKQSFFPDVSESFEIRGGDIYALCSDGLNNMVDDSVIKEHVMTYSPRTAVNKLVKLANRNGGTDNITLMVIKVEERGSKEKTEPIKIAKKKFSFASFFSKETKREEK